MANRQKLLIGVLLVVGAVVLIVHWLNGRGTVTLDFDNASLSKVIKSIEWQGGVRIATNANPDTPISIHVKRAPLFDAIDTVAVRAEGDARLIYVGAPTNAKIEEAIRNFSSNTDPGGWTAFGGGWGGGAMNALPDAAEIDPRRIEWKVSPVDKPTLQALLDQGTQKTGITFAVPADWNPAIVSLPKEGRVGDVAGKLASAAKGEIREVFLITVHPERPQDAQAEGGPPPNWQSIFSPQRGRGQQPNMEWVGERVNAQIAQLPPDERAKAKEQADQMRALFASMRGLSADERRQKMEDLMNRPEVQQAMEERQARRDSKMTPTQRENRMRQYVERRQSIRSSGQ